MSMVEPKGNAVINKAMRTGLEIAVAERDWPMVESLFLRYGHHLELLEFNDLA